MIERMPAAQPPTSHLGQLLTHRGLVWWHTVHLGAMVAALLLSPASWRGARRAPLLRPLVADALPLLLWFSLLSALISLVITHIVQVAALSYGLSQYALQMVVQVLVLELIPLTAALAVALRVSLPAAVALAQQRRSGRLAAFHGSGGDVLQQAVLPRALSSGVCVMLLAAASSVIGLVLAYLLVHGLSPWGFERFTRSVGQVFNPATSLIFCLKTGALAAAVAIIPLASSLHDHDSRRSPLPLELQGLLRLFVVLLAVEVVALMGNYY